MNPKRCNLDVKHYAHDWDFILIEDDEGRQAWLYSFCDGLVWL